ncbi:MAG TPA: bifunctional rhamnulose-1-phosphate aldolase/short-chain dehydrogenase [Vicinamibacteria bacterium]|nr:bifunctional rhamnulose-1-phosphate aldolase/short-chain dehydrogenase [Vicinamibacteria bacterium]
MTASGPIADAWDEEKARGLSEPELLLYRSLLLGSDRRITNYGGGNTSAKVRTTDPLTRAPADVLWVKGSGGDLGSIGLDGFATLYLDKLAALPALYRGREHEDEMAGLFAHCAFNLNPRATSIDTPPHAFIPHAHVDHMHADAIIALAAARHGERLVHEIFDGRIGWVPWQRPGFDLGLKIGALARDQPRLEGVVLGGHGLFTWGPTSRECYRTTLDVIRRAAAWIEARSRPAPFGPAVEPALPEAERDALVTEIAPVLRGRLSARQRKVMHHVATPEVMEFVNSTRAAELAPLGTTCPDHFLRTRVRPLFVPFAPGRESPADLLARLPSLVDGYRDEYTAYYERCRRPDSPAMRDPYPVIVLIPGVGLLSFQTSKATARVAAEFYLNAINVMRGAEGLDAYVPLPEQEAFDIEYWSLEEAKLRRLPAPGVLEGRVALVTGAAGGIGGATARRLLDEGACVVLSDLDADALAGVLAGAEAVYGADRVRAVRTDVTVEASVARAVLCSALEYGGLDVLVCCAGLASSAPYEETTLETWGKSLDVLATGYFLVSRDGFRLMQKQGLDGSVVFVGSKNALVASPDAAAYCTAKAAELHLARCLAVEAAEHGIRVNVVNPDAVIRGSKIWSGSWRKERAAGYNVPEDQLEEFYRQRSLLKRSVLPEDIAEAVFYFASDRSAKSTGNILNVDGGNAAAFTR